MAVTILWQISRLDTKPVEGSLTDVVYNANWRCMAFDPIYTGSSACGTCEFPSPTGTFTPYQDLTEAQVLQWCWDNGVDKTAVETVVATQQVTQPLLPLPWAT